MTDYVDVPVANMQPGDPGTDELFQALFFNLIAFAEGSITGDVAPRLAEQALDHAPVNRAALKTGVSSGSYSFGSGGGTTQINMHPYSFFPAHYRSGSATANIVAISNNADSPGVLISASGTASGTLHWRYVLT